MTKTTKQITWAAKHGFRHLGEDAFEALLDTGLTEGERYARDGWATKPGQGRLLPRLAVEGDRFTYYDRGRGRSREYPSARAAWVAALARLKAMTEGGYTVVTDLCP